MTLRFHTDVYGFHHGQTDCVLKASESDKPVGYIDYALYQDEVHINMISVGVERRRGIASALIRELAKEYPYESIQWGAMTPEGFALQEKMDKEFGFDRSSQKVPMYLSSVEESPCVCEHPSCPECSLRKNPIEFKEQDDKLLCGLCFPYAFKNVTDRGGTLVHAVVTAPLSIPVQKYAHAWVERRGKVYDWQTMEAGHGGKFSGKGWPVKVFYEVFQPEDVKKFTREKAAIEALRHQHYGPWEMEPNRERRFYITNYGGWWSLTETNFRKMLHGIIIGEGYNLDQLGKQIQQKPPWRPGVTCFKPLDWSKERAETTLEDLDQGKTTFSYEHWPWKGH